MRELAVYYCQKCGYYGYYQLSRNAICPKCDKKMTILNITYQEFMNLGYEERDEYLSREIIEANASVVQRLALSHSEFNTREVIANLSEKIQELEAENKKLNETVTWMHKTIWDLLKKNKNQQPPES